MSHNYELESKFRAAFAPIDKILALSLYDFRPSQLSDISSITYYLNVFLNRYSNVLSDDEKSILQERIDNAINRLMLVNMKDYYVLHYFRKNFSENPISTILRAQSILLSVRTLFEVTTDKIPLTSTIWNFFSDNIDAFVTNFNSTLQKCDDKILGRLAFLLLITINCLTSILSALERNLLIEDKHELYTRINKLSINLMNNLITLYQNTKLENLMEKSPGFVIFLSQVLNSNPLLNNPDILNIKLLTKNKLHKIPNKNLSDHSRNFHILNSMELGENPPHGISPSGNTPLALLAEGFIRFENGESFLGITQRDIYAYRN